MGARPPDGQPAPSDGRLPAEALSRDTLSVYVHVPFCASRCGYCDFNTYTPTELGSSSSPAAYLDAARAEIALARAVLGPRKVTTVFFGGGTPTRLPADRLGALLREIGDTFEIAPDAEVTTEANPDSVDERSLAELRDAGFNRISFGVQSTSPRALAVLDRTHTPRRSLEATSMARAAGFDRVSADMIFAIPGETPAELHETLDAVISTGVEHVSAYSLIVEDGTRLAAAVRRGEVTPVDDDAQADAYVQVDDVLTAAGLHWYEISNWTRPGGECRHNLTYWTGADWWGIGPGAHSHVGGVRWWNVRHPAAYADRLARRGSPAQAREVLDQAQRRAEEILLRLRLDSGLPLELLSDGGLTAAQQALADGLLQGPAFERGRGVLTLKGRLLADAVVRELVD